MKNKMSISQGVLTVTLVAIIIFLLQANYAPLVSGLEYDEIVVISDILEGKSIAYKSEDDSILVKVDDLYEARIAITTDLNISLPHAFTKNNDVKQEQIINAKANAIEESLTDGFECIEDVTVNLHMENNSESSLLLILTIKEDTEINSEQIDGIYNFLEKSVSSLSRKNITILDHNGASIN